MHMNLQTTAATLYTWRKSKTQKFCSKQSKLLKLKIMKQKILYTFSTRKKYGKMFRKRQL